MTAGQDIMAAQLRLVARFVPSDVQCARNQEGVLRVLNAHQLQEFHIIIRVMGVPPFVQPLSMEE